jgi:hypothetical protein
VVSFQFRVSEKKKKKNENRGFYHRDHRGRHTELAEKRNPSKAGQLKIAKAHREHPSSVGHPRHFRVRRLAAAFRLTHCLPTNRLRETDCFAKAGASSRTPKAQERTASQGGPYTGFPLSTFDFQFSTCSLAPPLRLFSHLELETDNLKLRQRIEEVFC